MMDVESTVATGSGLMIPNYFSPVRSNPHRALSVEEKCRQPVELALCYKRRELHYSLATGSAARLYKEKCSQAVQGEVQPGCTRGSAARLYKRKCDQAVELAFSYKRRELHYNQAVQEEVQAGCTRGNPARL